MSFLRVNNITNSTADGPVEFSNGLVIAADANLTSNTIVTTGSFTAPAFVGSGAGLTNLVGSLQSGTVVAQLLITT